MPINSHLVSKVMVMRQSILASIAGLVLLTAAECSAKDAQVVDVQAMPVALSADRPDLLALGKLRYQGGLALRSGEHSFGGLSSLRWDGDRLYTLSDQGGTWFSLSLIEKEGWLTGIASVRMAHLSGSDGAPLAGKVETDAESMNLNHGRCGPPVCKARSVSIGFERDHRILTWRLRHGFPSGRPTIFRDASDWLKRQPDNEGVEAMAGNGHVTLLLSEGLRTASGDASALLFRPGLNGSATSARPAVEIGVPAPGAARPSELAQIDDSHFILLRRSWNREAGFAVDVERLTLAGETATTEAIAHFAPPVTTDNYEGAAIRVQDGRAFLYLISDDNFEPDQRTLLLKFEIVD